MGGVPRYMCEAIDKEPHSLTNLDREVDALRQVLAGAGLFSTDEMRRGIEALPADAYDRLSYYQRWLCSMVSTLIAKGVVTEAELLAAMDNT
jgi:hypothetical protein